MTATDGADQSQLSRILRSAGVLTAFVAAGPAIGGFLVFCCLYPVMMLIGLDTTPVSDGSTEQRAFDPSALGGIAIFMTALGYAFGGPQAVLTGAWAAFTTFTRGSFSARGTIVAVIVATLLWIALIYSPISSIGMGAEGSQKTESAARIALTLTPVGIVSALFVRYLCRVLGLAPARQS